MHDAGIDTIGGKVPGDISLTIGIEYICDYLPTASKTLLASLRSCSLFRYTPYDLPAQTDLQSIALNDIEILSAVDRGDYIRVCCTNGTLEVAYDAVEVQLVEGTVISQLELETAANRSVAKWLARNKKSEPPSKPLT